MDLLEIKGVGPKTLEYLSKLNIHNVDDLMRYYPYRYNIYKPSVLENANLDETLILTGRITSAVKVGYIKRNFNRVSFSFETNNIVMNTIIFNRAFLAPHLRVGSQITVIGKYNRLKNQLTASDILLYGLTNTKVEPVYHMINGLKSSVLKKIIAESLKSKITIKEIIPDYLSQRYQFINTLDAIREIHNPTTTSTLKKAQLKLIYEEFFQFMFKINLLKYKNQIFDDFVIKELNDDTINSIISKIPFELTSDQLTAIKEIMQDFNALKRMNRLILGDVGSGKTIVAFIAILLNHQAGYQSALLAPTEVLAHQHLANFKSLFPDIKVELLVGSLTKNEKINVLNRLKNNEINLLIGTHAMLEDNVEFANIGLVVTDEQHRFGVNQRKSLQNKGKCVDVLYMSATPIPRTYALTIYGDMDISYIKEKPSGRKDILTKRYPFKDITKIVDEIETELSLSHQAYVIAPLIEDENETELSDIKKIKELLESNLHGKYSLGLLHGKMKQVDKDKIMNDFKEGNINILISTTVIEVGVDVKNATIIAIFNAERFGLATLHQLRGRVGRNSLQSKCILISDKDSERLSVLEESNDGFYISEKDFDIRGSGDLFGIRQSGDMTFKIGDIKRDFKILLQCKKDTEEFVLNSIENNFRDYSYFQNIVQDLMNND